MRHWSLTVILSECHCVLTVCVSLFIISGILSQQFINYPSTVIILYDNFDDDEYVILLKQLGAHEHISDSYIKIESM